MPGVGFQKARRTAKVSKIPALGPIK